jgi:hypothetical protein
MGVQFGICNCDGEPVRNDVLERVESLLVPYAPEGISTATVSPGESGLDDVGRPPR